MNTTQTITAETIVDAFYRITKSEDAFRYQLGNVICNAIDHVLDGETTLDALEACEKTYIGTKVEKKALKGWNLPTNSKQCRNLKLDTVIEGIDLDLKFTLNNNWMVPPENLNEWCLLIRADHCRGKFYAGVLQMTENNLTKGGNRDGKKTVSAEGKTRIRWMVTDGNLGE